MEEQLLHRQGRTCIKPIVRLSGFRKSSKYNNTHGLQFKRFRNGFPDDQDVQIKRETIQWWNPLS